MHYVFAPTEDPLRVLHIDVLRIFSPEPAIKPTRTTCYYMQKEDKFAQGETRYLPCRSRFTFRGRIVRITSTATNTKLILCEVKVHGIPGTAAQYLMSYVLIV